MNTKALTLSLFMATPGTNALTAYNSPIWESNWSTWRPFVPYVEDLTRGSLGIPFGNFFSSRPSDVNNAPQDFGHWQFNTTAYPINSVINRAKNTPDDGWNDEFFTLRVLSAPYRRRTIEGITPPYLAPNIFTYSLHEWCVDVEVDYPDFYLTRDYGGFDPSSGQPLGRVYTYPAELFNVDLGWRASVIVAGFSNNNGPVNNRTTIELHFRGGVQDFVAYTVPHEFGTGAALDYYDGNGNLMPPPAATYPVDNYNDLTVSVSGLKVSIDDHSAGTDTGDPLYKVGWSIGPTVAEHGWPTNIGILENSNRYGFTSLTEPGAHYDVVLPHQYSHLNIKRTYFTTKGRMLIVGKHSFDPSARFGVQAGSGESIHIALPEQRTAIAQSTVFTVIGANRPIEYRVGRDDVGVAVNPVSFNPADSALQIHSFDGLTSEGGEDISAPVISHPFSPERADSQMMGTGLSLYCDHNKAPWATWIRTYSDFPAPYERIPNSLSSWQVYGKRGEKWFPDQTSQLLDLPAALPTLNGFRFNSRWVPHFHVGSLYKWSPVVLIGQQFSVVPQQVQLRFIRSTTPIGGLEGTEGVLVAELDYLPFGHMPCLSASDAVQAGSTLWLTNGIDGCWESDSMGDSWSPREGWMPAFDAEFVPLDCAVLPCGPLSWGVLAMALPSIESNPQIYFRATHDGGATWEDVVEVGELPSTAWVWGCGLFSGHHHKKSYLLIANSDKLLWVSHSTGATWEEIPN